jgi:hypothetical protein
MGQPWPDTRLQDAIAGPRRIAAGLDRAHDESVYGGICENCGERWALPADKASCAHRNICEDCWPNGCEHCEAEVETGIRRREHLAAKILAAALALRTGADDLSEADMRQLDWVTRKDIVRHVELAQEALWRVHDLLMHQEGQG